jgi:CBS domain containing-hemolysin-like protein
MSLDDAILHLGKLLLVLALVFCNAFFVAAEFALVKLRDTQLTPLIRQGHRRARIARRVLDNLDAFISATQLGITVVGLALGAMVAPVFEGLLQPVFRLISLDSPQWRQAVTLFIGFFVNTFLLIVVGELAPKTLAIRRTLPVALWVAQPILWFYYMSYPFIWLLNSSSQWLVQQFGIKLDESDRMTHSPEELRLLISTSFNARHEVLPGRNIILNAMELRRRIVRDVMTPRQQIVALNTRSTLEECLECAEKTRYSRFPLCEDGDLDKSIGVIHIKDLYSSRHLAKTGNDLRSATRQIIYVPQTARLERLLQRLLDQKLHFALVIDEYGGTIGLATLENIIEELVGSIQDEFDQEAPLLRVLGTDHWEVSGALPLHLLSEVVGESIQEEGITTTSGLVTHRLGGFPKCGDRLPVGRFELVVQRMDGPKVDSLHLTRQNEEAHSRDAMDSAAAKSQESGRGSGT